MAKGLNEFFEAKKQRAVAESVAVDWEKRREEWLGAINDLYADIQNWLTGPIRSGDVSVQLKKRQTVEEHLGTYTVEDLNDLARLRAIVSAAFAMDY